MLALVPKLTSGLVLTPAVQPHGHAVQQRSHCVMQKRDAQGYLDESELTGWKELKKSTALGATVTEWKNLPESAQALIDSVRAGDVEFDATMAAIDEGYDATEVSFEVGDVKSAAGSNMGSGKILSLGILAGLNVEETLGLFGGFYRDVKATPDGDDHPNIRAFMTVGFEGVTFPTGLVLSPKSAFDMEAGDLSSSTSQVDDALAASAQIGEGDDWDPDSEIWIP